MASTSLRQETDNGCTLTGMFNFKYTLLFLVRIENILAQQILRALLYPRNGVGLSTNIKSTALSKERCQSLSTNITSTAWSKERLDTPSVVNIGALTLPLDSSAGYSVSRSPATAGSAAVGSMFARLIVSRSPATAANFCPLQPSLLWTLQLAPWVAPAVYLFVSAERMLLGP